MKAEVEKVQGAGNGRWYDDLDERGSGEDEEMGGIEGEGEGEGGKGMGEDEWIEVTVDMPGQRDDDAVVVFLAQMIHEGLVADGGLRNRLVINARWHWRLYIDVRTPPPASSSFSNSNLPTTHRQRLTIPAD